MRRSDQIKVQQGALHDDACLFLASHASWLMQRLGVEHVSANAFIEQPLRRNGEIVGFADIVVSIVTPDAVVEANRQTGFDREIGIHCVHKPKYSFFGVEVKTGRGRESFGGILRQLHFYDDTTEGHLRWILATMYPLSDLEQDALRYSGVLWVPFKMPVPVTLGPRDS